MLADVMRRVQSDSEEVRTDIFISFDGGIVRSLNLETSAINWSKDISGATGEGIPVYDPNHDEVVWIDWDTQVLYKLSAETGDVITSHSVFYSSTYGASRQHMVGPDGSVAVPYYYIYSGPGRMNIYNRDGSRRFAVALGTGRFPSVFGYSPDGSKVFLGTNESDVFNINANTSGANWYYEDVEGLGGPSGDIDQAGNTFFHSDGWTIVKLNPSGSKVWDVTVQTGGSAIAIGPDDSLYELHNHFDYKFRKFDVSGASPSVDWTILLTDYARDISYAHDGSIIVTTYYGKVYKRDPVDGSIIWTYSDVKSTINDRPYCGTAPGHRVTFPDRW